MYLTPRGMRVLGVKEYRLYDYAESSLIVWIKDHWNDPEMCELSDSPRYNGMSNIDRLFIFKKIREGLTMKSVNRSEVRLDFDCCVRAIFDFLVLTVQQNIDVGLIMKLLVNTFNELGVEHRYINTKIVDNHDWYDFYKPDAIRFIEHYSTWELTNWKKYSNCERRAEHYLKRMRIESAYIHNVCPKPSNRLNSKYFTLTNAASQLGVLNTKKESQNVSC